MKIDNAKFKKQFGFKARMLGAEEVAMLTGHEVGGVCPFANPNTSPLIWIFPCSWFLRVSGGRKRQFQRLNLPVRSSSNIHRQGNGSMSVKQRSTGCIKNVLVIRAELMIKLLVSLYEQ